MAPDYYLLFPVLFVLPFLILPTTPQRVILVFGARNTGCDTINSGRECGALRSSTFPAARIASAITGRGALRRDHYNQ